MAVSTAICSLGWMSRFHVEWIPIRSDAEALIGGSRDDVNRKYQSNKPGALSIGFSIL